MHIVFPAVTLLVAAALGLINFWIGFRVSQLRHRFKISIGAEGNQAVEARMRAHANFIENVPLALILMMLVEMSGGAPTGLWVLGVLLIVSRVMHPLGMDRPAPNPLRMVGTVVTSGVLLSLVIWGLVIAYTARG